MHEPPRARAPDRVWESATFSARAVRALLIPAAALYAAGVKLRNIAYDRGVFRTRDVALPTVAVGNLTVGGTGKTPVAAFIAAQLMELGATPAIVMRGYGGDEPLVHELLNPGIAVITDPDRVRGIALARARGATVAVLDDGFQHRRARRDADIVLLSADVAGPVRPLPAGPWREPLGSLRRATVVIVTRKNASLLRARELLGHLRRFAPHAATAIAHLAFDRLVAWQSAEEREPPTLAGQHVLAVTAIGDPRSFYEQLAHFGAHAELVARRDHHAYSPAEASALARRAAGFETVVCTLKDAVKLGPIWPREAPPLWYLSQRVNIEVGGRELSRILAAVAVRNSTTDVTTPAPAGPTNDTHGA
jgi:tetraacyldisaccharide 4'-kinase